MHTSTILLGLERAKNFYSSRDSYANFPSYITSQFSKETDVVLLYEKIREMINMRSSVLRYYVWNEHILESIIYWLYFNDQDKIEEVLKVETDLKTLRSLLNRLNTIDIVMNVNLSKKVENRIKEISDKINNYKVLCIGANRIIKRELKVDKLSIPDYILSINGLRKKLKALEGKSFGLTAIVSGIENDLSINITRRNAIKSFKDENISRSWGPFYFKFKIIRDGENVTLKFYDIISYNEEDTQELLERIKKAVKLESLVTTFKSKEVIIDSGVKIVAYVEKNIIR